MKFFGQLGAVNDHFFTRMDLLMAIFGQFGAGNAHLWPANNQQFSNMQFRPAITILDKFGPANNHFQPVWTI